MDWGPEQQSPQLLAADAAALYPSLNHHLTAEVIRREVMNSKLKVHGTDWRELAKYLKLTSTPAEISRWKVKKFMPRRGKSGGRAPTIKGAEAKGATKESTQWDYPDLQPSEHDIKLLLAACLAVGVKETFRSHIYTLGA